MNESTKKACIFGGLVVATYALYIGGNAATGQSIPDGVVFGAVVGALAAIGGYVVGLTAKKQAGP